jgi:hypothetical protein
MTNDIKEMLKWSLCIIVLSVMSVLLLGSLFFSASVSMRLVEYGLCRLGALTEEQLLTPDGKCKPIKMRD